jgi:spermidine/putrescine transport system permease protein
MTAVEVETPGTRPRARKRRRSRLLRGRGLHSYTWLIVCWLYLPILVMIAFGFNNTSGKYNFTWQGFTLTWYRHVFALPDLTHALVNSLTIALIATVISTTLGTLVGMALGKYRFRGRGGVDLVLFAAIASPEVVLGSALLSLFLTFNVALGYLTIVICHVMFCIPFVAVTVRARMAGFDHALEEAARDLGASAWTTFRLVTLPLLLPGVMAGALLAFALSIDDYIITSFNAGQTLTFPLWIWGATRVGVPPQVNVMGTLIFVVGIGAAVANAFALRRRRTHA